MTWFDAVVLSVIGLSTLFAAIRGGLREAATLIALGGGGFASFLVLKPILSATGGEHSFFITAAVAAVMIVVFFIGFYIALHMALRRFALNGRGLVIDKTVGGVFGALRGLVLVGLAYLGYGYYLDEPNQPEAVRDAVTQPLAAAAAGFFENLAPDSAYIHTHDGDADKPDQNTGAKASVQNATEAGYARGDRAGLSEMITTMTTSDAQPPEAEAAKPDTKEKAKKEDDDDPIADILDEDNEP